MVDTERWSRTDRQLVGVVRHLLAIGMGVVGCVVTHHLAVLFAFYLPALWAHWLIRPWHGGDEGGSDERG